MWIVARDPLVRLARFFVAPLDEIRTGDAEDGGRDVRVVGIRVDQRLPVFAGFRKGPVRHIDRGPAHVFRRG